MWLKLKGVASYWLVQQTAPVRAKPDSRPRLEGVCYKYLTSCSLPTYFSCTVHGMCTLAHTYQFPSSPWASIVNHCNVSALRSRVGWTTNEPPYGRIGKCIYHYRHHYHCRWYWHGRVSVNGTTLLLYGSNVGQHWWLVSKKDMRPIKSAVTLILRYCPLRDGGGEGPKGILADPGSSWKHGRCISCSSSSRVFVDWWIKLFTVDAFPVS